MQSSVRKAGNFFGFSVLVIVLCVSGVLAAKLAECSGFSPFTCSFICGFVVMLFALDNFSLIVEIKQHEAAAKSEVLQKLSLLEREQSHILIIKQLTETNRDLVQRNIKLKDMLEERNTREIEKGNDAVKAIIHWRTIWNSPLVTPCQSEHYAPPPEMMSRHE